MDMSPSPLDLDLLVVQQHLSELRAEARREAIAVSLRPWRRSLRVALGASLITLGRLMLGPAHAV